ncbi:methyl-accepting chemotaxis protein [Oharaeibacter diazotrophicus]|uniref:Methyl-accepting chemotaxis sensory transducer with Pas/Pac sensor n=1 Tax=Oharaeibacter diazotrophicus TaxID=1920512 RepID=A0A4R6RIN8_9HYPH|nr:PAS domain-containing methyl-accepting chemotaxis protein [Oharaeibacter diazotrophicus]TDP86389.1 methyl-accepting chemotaxis sensory transducer with Pas/Pac sensor [Oharaeibacter diazotrophicus]BBE71668.1 biofilm dispersion protein BdlA [Pleomorphomonas sp. SM30]GLS78433.1 methyl-accepting chemotaxis protein [Oharaeibacter diazotrophicus]
MALFGTNDAQAILDAFGKSQAMIEFAPDGTILTANANFLAAVGYSLDEVKGKNHSMFVESGYRESAEYKRFWDELRAGKFQMAEFKRIAKGGRDVWIQASYNPVFRGGKVVKVVKIATDVTAAKLNAADMAGQLAAIDKAQGTIEFDLDGTVRTANKNFLDVVGYRLDEVKGRHHSMFVDPRDRDSAEYRGFWAALARGEFQAARYKRVAKGGREVWIQASYNPILDMSGKPFKVVKFATDITREVADQLRRQEAQRAIDVEIGGVVDTISLVNAEATSAAAASTQTSDNVQAVAAGAEELSASVNEITRQVTQARQISTHAVEEADRTNVIVSGLSTAAQRIGDVVQLIQNIAAQTNLLALNATIEAARAGEAGRGFAVVASEVKSLANQTAKATEEISAQINAVQDTTNGAVGAISTISSTIVKISEISAAIASAVEEQSAVAAEMSSNMRVAADGVATISQNMNSIASSTRAIDGATRKVREASAALR